MSAAKLDVSVKNISPKLGGERGTSYKNGPTSSHDLVEQMDFLYIELIKTSQLNPKPQTFTPIIEITLGNYKSSTKTLIPNSNSEINQVFAFDKSKGDILSVTLKDPHQIAIGKHDFSLVLDIPTRIPPDARIAPQWYQIKNTETGYQFEVLMSVWFGTQADEVYSQAWFSDAYTVNATRVINTRPKLYLAPRLCYIRVTIISGHDLIPISQSQNQKPPVYYVKANLGLVSLKTGLASGLTPSWNQDLIFVASEPLDETVHISLIHQIDDQHEQCIGNLKKKLSEMTPLKLPGSAPAYFYDIEPPVNVKQGLNSKNFSSKLKMKLATDQAYHVFDESSQYCSDYRAYAKGLWLGIIGKLEIGILGATGLETMKTWTDGRKSTDAYVVAKYGNKWARTRTVVDNLSPKWNEQYSWDIYDKATVLTVGIYDNCQIFGSNNYDIPIGKVRIRLNLLKFNKIYTFSIPILDLRRDGLKKSGEIQIAIRCRAGQSQTFSQRLYGRLRAPLIWILPKAHYKSPLSLFQLEALRVQAVNLTCLNLAKTEPPLRSEVVLDMLKPKDQRFSMRKIKANYERLYRIVKLVFGPYVWIDSKIVSSTNLESKIGVLIAFGIVIFEPLLLFLVVFVGFIVIGLRKFYDSWRKKNLDVLSFVVDLEISKVDSVNSDELDEEFDSFPTSVNDVKVLRMRYDRLRKMLEKVTSLMGGIASELERIEAIMTWSDPLASVYCLVFCGLVLWVMVMVKFGFRYVLLGLVVYWLKFPCFRNDLPSGVRNFFRRLPTKEDFMI